MDWKALALLPVTMVTFISPPAQTLPEVVLGESPVAGIHVIASTTPELVNPEPEVITGEKATSTSVALRSQLKPICGCESGGGPFNEPVQFNADGSVLQGRVNPLDTGMCQINKKYWLTEAISLGYDINTKEGNISMANVIYDRHGTQPWTASKSCWGKAL